MFFFLFMVLDLDVPQTLNSFFFKLYLPKLHETYDSM